MKPLALMNSLKKMAEKEIQELSTNLKNISLDGPKKSPRKRIDDSYWKTTPDIIVQPSDCTATYFKLFSVEKLGKLDTLTLKHEILDYFSIKNEKDVLFSYKYLRQLCIPRYLQYKSGHSRYNIYKGWQSHRPTVLLREEPRMKVHFDILRKLKGPSHELDGVDFLCNKAFLKIIFEIGVFRSAGGFSYNVVRLGNCVVLSNNSYREIEHINLVKMDYAGHKFEQIITKGLEDSGNDSDPAGSFKLLMKSSISHGQDTFNIVYTSESDCLVKGGLKDLTEAQILDPASYGEIKTTNSNPHHLKHKLALAYIQASLSGMSKVIVGKRTELGWIEQVEQYDVDELGDYLRKEGYDFNRGMEYLMDTLKWIKEKVTQVESKGTVWRLSKEKYRLKLVQIEGSPVETIRGYVLPKTIRP